MLGDKPLSYKREVDRVDVRRQAVVIRKGNEQSVIIKRVRDQALY